MTRQKGYPRRVGAAVLLLAMLVVPGAAGTAHGSERSTYFWSDGVLAFRDARYPDALALFEQAVAADPNDVSARYYRGVTLGRLGSLDAAIADLRSVLAARPTFDEAALELGVALVQSERPGEAVACLEQARRSADADVESRAAFFLGLARLRLGDPQRAREEFERAERDPTQRTAARYYEGVTFYRERRLEDAASRFTEVAAAGGQTAIATEASRYLEVLGGRGGRRYSLYGSVGFEYDSNVLLAPSDDQASNVLAIGDRSDGSAVLRAGGRYVVWRNARAELSLGYEFSQSLHFRLTEFDLQDHRPSLELTTRWDFATIGLAARYDYYRLESDSFLQQATVLPWIQVPEGDVGHVDVYYRLRRQDFFARRFADRLEGFNHAAAVSQVFHLDGPDRYAWVGYRFDREESSHAAGSAFSYDGHQAEGGVGWAFPSAAVTGKLSYRYRHEQYDRASNGRRDDEHQVAFDAERRLNDHLVLRLGYLGSFNPSNVSLFDYTRHIGMIAVDVTY